MMMMMIVEIAGLSTRVDVGHIELVEMPELDHDVDSQAQKLQQTVEQTRERQHCLDVDHSVEQRHQAAAGGVLRQPRLGRRRPPIVGLDDGAHLVDDDGGDQPEDDEHRMEHQADDYLRGSVRLGGVGVGDGVVGVGTLQLHIAHIVGVNALDELTSEGRVDQGTPEQQCKQ